MTKTELIAGVSEKAGLTKKAAGDSVKAVFDVLSEALEKGEDVSILGFGTFKVKERPARKGRNPRTGEVTDIAASKVVGFKPGKQLKDSVNK